MIMQLRTFSVVIWFISKIVGAIPTNDNYKGWIRIYYDKKFKLQSVANSIIILIKIFSSLHSKCLSMENNQKIRMNFKIR